jgi:hypothetical protein
MPSAGTKLVRRRLFRSRHLWKYAFKRLRSAVAAGVGFSTSNLENIMKNRVVMTTAIACLWLAPALPASAQSLKQQVVGTWTLTSGIEKLPDGKTVAPWAAGSLVLGADGHVSFMLVGKDRPKADDNPRVPVGPLVAYYGSYTVDEATMTLTYNIEFGASPAFDKAVRKQTVALNGEVMTMTGSPVKTPQGEITPVNEWKRTK